MNQMKWLLMVVVFGLVSCDRSGYSGYDNSGALDYMSLERTPEGDYEILLIGNSHSSYQNFPGMVKKLIELGTGKTANTFNAPGWGFLDERSFDGLTKDSIESRPWTHVILQAQKYSTTGMYHYPTDAAEEWVRIVKGVEAIPVMYPEHPRAGNGSEGQRIYDLHVSIAHNEPTCVAPISPAWDLASTRYPNLRLHHVDGNHFNESGALLSAMVFYQVITGQSARELPFIDFVQTDEATQENLKHIASDTIEAYPPCEFYES